MYVRIACISARVACWCIMHTYGDKSIEATLGDAIVVEIDNSACGSKNSMLTEVLCYLPVQIVHA